MKTKIYLTCFLNTSLRLLPAFCTQRMFWRLLFLLLWFYFSTLASPLLPSILPTGMTTVWAPVSTLNNSSNWLCTAALYISGLEDVGAQAQEVEFWRHCETLCSSHFSLDSPGFLPSLVPLSLSSGLMLSSTAARGSTFFSTASLLTGRSEARYISFVPSSFLSSHRIH